MHTDAQTQSLTYRQTDGHKKVKIKKNNTNNNSINNFHQHNYYMPVLILHLTKQEKNQNSIWKNLKSNTAVVNAGPPNREHMYYSQDMEGVTLRGSLLPALR